MALDPVTQALVQGFAVEAQELCEKVTRDLLELERVADHETAARAYASVARGLHTLKGTAATLGFEDLSLIAHRLEDLVAPHRAAQAALPGTVTDAMLRSLDALLATVRARAEGREVESPLAEVSALLDGTPDAPPEGEAPAPTPKAAPEPERASPPPPPAPAPVIAEPAAEPDDGTWRVKVRDVMALMREVERLRELRLRLELRRRQLDDAVHALARIPGTEDARLSLSRLVTALGGDASESGDIVDSAEDGLKIIGTQPLRTVLDPLERTVRDLARQLGKHVRLELVGGEVAIDRGLLGALRGPLVHLVRNAVDHGIELPNVREAAGKHVEGVITVRVEQQGNMLFVTVEDDGGGIDTDRVRDVALERGVAAAERLATMTAPELQQLVFEAGFSTAKTITEASGRGVGLDVVKNQVRALEGLVEAQSARGQGTRFILTLPVEFGSSPLLAVRAGEHRFGVPMPAIEAVVAADRETIHATKSRAQLAFRDQLVPVFTLQAVLGLGQAQAPEPGTPLVVLRAQSRHVAVAVDEVLGDRELVIRPLPPELRDVPAYQGAATLAGGELLLVLRADWLADSHARPRALAQESRRALVVDDSLTARALHRTMLESSGFTVHTASSGPQALGQLERAAYDVVVCDIGMEGMDGFDFTRALRQKSETRALPVILVSAHDSDADKARGLAAGADAFLSKRECVSGRLVKELQLMISRRRAAS